MVLWWWCGEGECSASPLVSCCNLARLQAGGGGAGDGVGAPVTLAWWPGEGAAGRYWDAGRGMGGCGAWL